MEITGRDLLNQLNQCSDTQLSGNLILALDCHNGAIITRYAAVMKDYDGKIWLTGKSRAHWNTLSLREVKTFLETSQCLDSPLTFWVESYRSVLMYSRVEEITPFCYGDETCFEVYVSVGNTDANGDVLPERKPAIMLAASTPVFKVNLSDIPARLHDEAYQIYSEADENWIPSLNLDDCPLAIFEYLREKVIFIDNECFQIDFEK